MSATYMCIYIYVNIYIYNIHMYVYVYIYSCLGDRQRKAARLRDAVGFGHGLGRSSDGAVMEAMDAVCSPGKAACVEPFADKEPCSPQSHPKTPRLVTADGVESLGMIKSFFL